MEVACDDLLCGPFRNLRVLAEEVVVLDLETGPWNDGLAKLEISNSLFIYIYKFLYSIMIYDDIKELQVK